LKKDLEGEGNYIDYIETVRHQNKAMKENEDKLNMPEDKELSFHKNNGKKF